MPSYILSIDQGTTSSRSIIFNHAGKIVAVAQKEFKQHYPQAGWVEHDPMEIWRTQYETARHAIGNEQVEAIGITNQRETTVVWDRSTGEPIHPAIVWQDRRTAVECDFLKAEGRADWIAGKTGLIPDAYFSATKLRWLLDHVPGARAKAGAENHGGAVNLDLTGVEHG